MSSTNFLNECSPLDAALAYADLFSRHVKGMKAQANWQLMGLCPFHEDRNPSLSINPESGLWRCFGCGESGNAKQFAEKVGESWQEARDSNGHGRTLQAIHQYKDAEGRLVFEVLRFTPKGFTQRRPDGAGGWIWNVTGIQRIPYRLHDLAEAKPESLFIAEGEKDVDRLWDMGLPATCNSGGAGQWRKQYTDTLLSFLPLREVLILADNDEPGRKHARHVARSFLGKVAVVTLVATLPDVPTKGDVSDYLRTHSKAELWAVIEQTPALRLEDLGQQSEDSGGTASVTPVEPIGGYRLTDVGNSARFAAMHGHAVRHVKQWSQWLCWNSKRWVRDETGEVVRLARETVDNLYREAAAEPDEMRRKVLGQHAVRSDSAAKIAAMLSLAESEPAVAIRPDDLDRHGWLLNCANGTLDLKTGLLRPHQRDDLITKLAPVAYDPEATCPTFDAYLRQIMGGNADLFSYLQRLVGYCLTADVAEQGFDLFYGTGANGKSTLLTIILAMLGDYGKQAAPGLLMRKYGDVHPTEVADLHGARFVSVIEVEEGKHLAEVLTKQLTGGDRLKARLMRQDFFEFEPTFKIIMAVNHLPRVTGTDEAIWRRIRTTPFSVTIPKARQDKRLPEKLKPELPGILAWAVCGCLEWHQRGLDPPREVQAATAQYRTESDLIGGFLDECTRATGQGHVLAKDLYIAYCRWCEDNGERARSQRQFGAALSERGFARQRVRQGHSWLGLELIGASAP